MDDTRPTRRPGVVRAHRHRAATPTRGARPRSTAASPDGDRADAAPAPSECDRLRRRAHPPELRRASARAAGTASGDQHRVARRLAAADPPDRGHGQPRRHALAVRHDHRPAAPSRRPPGHAGAFPRPSSSPRSPARWRSTTRSARAAELPHRWPLPRVTVSNRDRNVELLREGSAARSRPGASGLELDERLDPREAVEPGDVEVVAPRGGPRA